MNERERSEEIRAEVARQLRGQRHRSWRRFGLLLLVLAFSGRLAWAQQQVAGFGGQHQMADLFKVFFSWDATTLTVNDARTVVSTVASGSNAFSQSNGAKHDFGSGTDDTIESNGTYLKVGSTSNGYVASATPVAVASVYVNNTLSAFIYGGGTLPANANTITAVSYFVRAGGAGNIDGGITDNNTFQIADGISGTNKCGCTFRCDEDAGPHIALCVNDAGTGCVYSASAPLVFSFPSVGQCTTTTDLLGNMTVWGKWQ